MILHIEKLVTGALGLGRLADGMVALVPYVLPGETVRIKPVKKKKSYIEARLVEVLEPSPHRVTPPCPCYGECGGCNFQHVAYPAQPDFKSSMLAEQLLRAGLVSAAELPAVLTPPLAAPLPFNYRQRIRLRINADGECGFLYRRSQQIVTVNNCLAARQELNHILAHLHDFSCLRHLVGLSVKLELQLSPVDGQVFLLFHFSRKPRPTDIKAAREGAEKMEHGAIVLLAKGYGRFGPYSAGREPSPLISLSLNVQDKKEIYFRFEPGTFCQVNTAQNERLVNLLLDWAEVGKHDRVLDLFCGMGNFSLPLALFAQEVLGMDLQRAAIRSAGRNADEAELNNCRFLRLSAEQGAKQCLDAKDNFDLVLLDPPRSGCREVIPLISGIKPTRIIYISCDPATLCRDLALLTTSGYKISRIKMVDMFPQTHHIESISLLVLC